MINWAKEVAEHVNKKYGSNYTEEQIRDDNLAWYCFDIGVLLGVKMNVVKAVVLTQRNTCDSVKLYTDLPCPYSKEFDDRQEKLLMRFDTTQGTGAKYVRDNFGVEPEIIDLDPPRSNFSG